MPERPRTHRIERESRGAFAAALKPRFASHERTPPEYGIDGDVEEFDENDRATGLHFFAQLKATDEPELSRALAVTVPVATADHYRGAKLPVLMRATTQARMGGNWRLMPG
jgi:hypothetical protein